MTTRKRILPLVLGLLVLLLLLAVTAVAQGPTSESDPQPVVPLRPIFTLAHPRAGIVNLRTGGAENFLNAPDSSTEPLLTVPAGETFRLTAPYETVMYGLTAGWAEFYTAAYLQTDNGGEQLLDEAKAAVVGFGPRVFSGALNLDLVFDAPGTYQVRFHSVTSVKPVGASEPTTDEDEMVATIEVVAPEEAGIARRPQLTGWFGPQHLPTSQPISPAPTLTPAQAIATRTAQVALPRGHMVDGRNLAVDNFPRAFNAPIVLRPGQTLRIVAGPYEFVWYDGAVGSAETSLTVLRVRTDREPGISLGTDRVEYTDVQGPARRRGRLQVGVSFEEPGTYFLVARVRSAMRPTASADARGVVDEDVVYLKVMVVGEPETGAIAGVVTAADTLLPLPGVPVRAYQAATRRPVAETRTDDEGRYMLEGLKPGAYLVQALPDRQNYLGEWYDDRPRREDADPVPVQAGQVTRGIDFALTPGASITGRVTADPSPGEAPRPLGDILIQVGVFDPALPEPIVVGQTRTLEDGRYAVYQLPPGTYWVRALDPEGLYRTEYWDDASTLEEADPVELATGEWVDGIDFGLAPAGGAIIGRVVAELTPTDGTTVTVIVPLPGIQVTAVEAETGTVAGRGETDPEGRYRIAGLPAGRYLVHAEDPRGRYRDEWYDDKPSQEEADPVPVENGRITRGINFALAPVVQAPTLLRIDPPTTSVAQPGTSFEIALFIEGVEDLGSFEATLTYDPAVVHVEGAELGGFLSEPPHTDREYHLLDPIIDNEAGEARFGVFSLGQGPGVSGSGTVLVIRMSAQGVGDTVLHLQDVQVLNTAPELIPTRTEDGQVYVGECLAYDFDCDCDVDIVDVSKVAKRWGTVEGDPEYDPRYDLDSDGDIDIVDVAIIAAAWGTVCEDRPGGGGAQRSALPRSVEPLQEVELRSTTVSVAAPEAPVRVGETVEVAVRVAEGVDVKSFEFTLAYDPAVVQALDAQLGNFLAGAFVLGPIIDNEAGTIRFGAADLGLDPGAAGDGTLAVLRFQVVGVGSSPLTFTNVQLVDSFDRVQSDVGWVDGTLVAEGEAAYLPLVRRG